MHVEARFLLERGSIPDTDLGAAVAHIAVRAVVGEAPSLARIIEGSDLSERVLIVDEAGVVLPGKFDDLLIQDGDSFAEIERGKLDFLKHLARFEFHFTKRGAAFEASSFIERTCAKFQALGECIRIMWIDVDDLITVLGRRGKREERDHKECENLHASSPLRRISSATSTAAFIPFTSWTRTILAP